jgi:hypothetical protein
VQMNHKRTVNVRYFHGPSTREKAGMNAWSWVPIGLVAWFGVSLAVGMWLGPVLMYCSRIREAQGAHISHRMGHAPPSGS